MIKTVSGNSNNELVDYAVRKSDALRAKIDTASTEAEKSAILEKARQDAVYQLSDTISTTSKSKVKRTVTCSADIFVTVEGTTAQKQVDFKVEQAKDGELSVSVSPFQFDPTKD